MSFRDKIKENLAIVNYCKVQGKFYNPGISRAYYAAYLSAKNWLFEQGYTDGNFWMKAMQNDVDKNDFKGMEANTFSHGSIWTVAKAERKKNAKSTSLRIFDLGKTLHTLRKKADYEMEKLPREVFDRSIVLASLILKEMGVEDDLLK